jgi:hypothetical protein
MFPLPEFLVHFLFCSWTADVHQPTLNEFQPVDCKSRALWKTLCRFCFKFIDDAATILIGNESWDQTRLYELQNFSRRFFDCIMLYRLDVKVSFLKVGYDIDYVSRFSYLQLVIKELRFLLALRTNLVSDPETVVGFVYCHDVPFAMLNADDAAWPDVALCSSQRNPHTAGMSSEYAQ